MVLTRAQRMGKQLPIDPPSDNGLKAPARRGRKKLGVDDASAPPAIAQKRQGTTASTSTIKNNHEKRVNKSCEGSAELQRACRDADTKTAKGTALAVQPLSCSGSSSISACAPNCGGGTKSEEKKKRHQVERKAAKPTKKRSGDSAARTRSSAKGQSNKALGPSINLRGVRGGAEPREPTHPQNESTKTPRPLPKVRAHGAKATLEITTKGVVATGRQTRRQVASQANTEGAVLAVSRASSPSPSRIPLTPAAPSSPQACASSRSEDHQYPKTSLKASPVKHPDLADQVGTLPTPEEKVRVVESEEVLSERRPHRALPGVLSAFPRKPLFLSPLKLPPISSAQLRTPRSENAPHSIVGLDGSPVRKKSVSHSASGDDEAAFISRTKDEALWKVFPREERIEAPSTSSPSHAQPKPTLSLPSSFLPATPACLLSATKGQPGRFTRGRGDSKNQATSDGDQGGVAHVSNAMVEALNASFQTSHEVAIQSSMDTEFAQCAPKPIFENLHSENKAKFFCSSLVSNAQNENDDDSPPRPTCNATSPAAALSSTPGPGFKIAPPGFSNARSSDMIRLCGAPRSSLSTTAQPHLQSEELFVDYMDAYTRGLTPTPNAKHPGLVPTSESPAAVASLSRFQQKMASVLPLQTTPFKSALRSPGKKWDAKTPRKNVTWQTTCSQAISPREVPAKNCPLKGLKILVDVQSEGRDVGDLFVPLLERMGAQVIREWARRGTGVTHVLFKNGNLSNLQRLMEGEREAKCVNVGWAIE